MMPDAEMFHALERIAGAEKLYEAHEAGVVAPRQLILPGYPSVIQLRIEVGGCR